MSDHSNALGWCVSRVRMTGASGGGEGARGSVSAYFHGRVDPIKPSVKVTYNIIFHLLHKPARLLTPKGKWGKLTAPPEIINM